MDVIKIKDPAAIIICQVGETVRLYCNTNCPHTWWFSDSNTGARRQIFSDFYNPPYFYLMVARATMSGQYYCRIDTGMEAAVQLTITHQLRSGARH